MFRVFSVSALFLVFIVSSISGQQEESAASRVDRLRKHLSDVETTYREIVDISQQSPNAKLDFLRQELRGKFIGLVQKSTSSEATLALLRADADSSLEIIKTYETNLSAGDGEFTTHWNIFSEPELKTLRGKLNVRNEILRKEILNMPPEQRPLALEFRKREIETMISNIDSELNRRANISQVRLKQIRGDLTIDEAKLKFKSIEAIDGPAGWEKNFKRNLSLQIRFRLQSAPSDAALINLQNSLPKNTPPETGSLEIRGPPKSTEDAGQMLKRVELEEVFAVKKRDSVKIAKARAKIRFIRNWLKLNSVNVDDLGLLASDNNHLLNLREQWREWSGNLASERGPASNASVEIEINEAKIRIKQLDEKLGKVLFPRPPPDDTFGSSGDPAAPPDKPDSPKSPGLRAFERSWENQLADDELTELRKQVNIPEPIPNHEIAESAIETNARKIKTEAKLLNETFDETVKLKKQAFINGRSSKTAQIAEQINELQKNIQTRANELLDSFADAKLTASEEYKSLKSIVSENRSSRAAKNLNQILTDFETSADNFKVIVQSSKAEIQMVSGNEIIPVVESRIQLNNKLPEPAVPVEIAKPPSEYTDLYKKTARPQTLPEILRNPKTAPGGVIIDAVFSSDVSRRIENLDINVESGNIKIKIDGVMRTVETAKNPLLARVAWAFVLDGRRTLIDLRPLEDNEARWFYFKYGKKRLTEEGKNNLARQLSILTSVNVNDAVRDTSVGLQLINTDQLMFDLLPKNIFRIQGGDTRYGLPLDTLREAFRSDAGAELNRPNWQNTLFKKSIISISDVTLEIETDRVLIEPKFSFHLFAVPPRGNEIERLKFSELWFAKHEPELSKVPQLSWLKDFAVLVTLFRAVDDQKLPNNLDELIKVSIPETTTPRYIMRKDNVENWQQLINGLSAQ